MTCFALCFFLETKEVRKQMHKTIHWLNEEGSYAHIRISLFSMTQIAVFQGEQVDGKYVCVFMCAGGRVLP